jgi:hypothetical protein
VQPIVREVDRRRCFRLVAALADRDDLVAIGREIDRVADVAVEHVRGLPS